MEVGEALCRLVVLLLGGFYFSEQLCELLLGCLSRLRSTRERCSTGLRVCQEGSFHWPGHTYDVPEAVQIVAAGETQLNV